MTSPEASIAAPVPGDGDACREILRTGSRSFHAASLLLPPLLRGPSAAIYAFCREADDAIDGQDHGGPAAALSRAGEPFPSGASAHAQLQRLAHRLDAAYAGRPLPTPVDRALAEVVERFALPRALFDALLEGFEWDAQGRRYEDLSGVLAYSARVAGAVGAILSVLMGRREPTVVARACDLGVAMQLTNIARDVGEDARRGRIYLPLDELRAAGLDPDTFVAAPHFDPRVARVVDHLLVVAGSLYARADSGISALPRSCRPAIRAARLIYSEIGEEVRRAGLDSVSHRAVVGPLRKALLVLRSLPAALWPERVDPAPPLPETRFLVEAAG